MITVLLVDDYPAMRELLREILERYADIQVIGEASTGEDALVQNAILSLYQEILCIKQMPISSDRASQYFVLLLLVQVKV